MKKTTSEKTTSEKTTSEKTTSEKTTSEKTTSEKKSRGPCNTARGAGNTVYATNSIKGLLSFFFNVAFLYSLSSI